MTDKKASKSNSRELSSLFAVAANRSDEWRQLNALTRAWAAADAKSPKAKSLASEAQALFSAISRLEYCWAYPGPRLLAGIAAAFEGSDAGTAARLVLKVSAALLSGGFSSRRHGLGSRRGRRCTHPRQRAAGGGRA